ncbi:MAG: carbon storage regulator [Gammaproteobacteria bacterium]|nr:MAG: carbon storage regulator [Gammaproteobacteria bacterium]
MLALALKDGQTVRISPDETPDPATPAGELFRDGAIEVTVVRHESGRVWLAFRAPREPLILRTRLPWRGG